MNISSSFILRWINSILDLSKILGFLSIPKYVRDYLKFNYLVNEKEVIHFWDSYPCFRDDTSHTSFDPHYFYQSCWLARQLSSRKALQHVDVASDIRLIGTISGFINTTFIDYRPLQTSLQGLSCTQGDILNLPFPDESVESLSCLHVIEHIGLGRYGDPLDPDGSIKAAKELSRILKPNGYLYISVPIGRERICFNAHRVFSPNTVIEMFSALSLVDFSFADDNKNYLDEVNLDSAINSEYACGMFVFTKNKIN